MAGLKGFFFFFKCFKAFLDGFKKKEVELGFICIWEGGEKKQ